MFLNNILFLVAVFHVGSGAIADINLLDVPASGALKVRDIVSYQENTSTIVPETDGETTNLNVRLSIGELNSSTLSLDLKNVNSITDIESSTNTNLLTVVSKGEDSTISTVTPSTPLQPTDISLGYLLSHFVLLLPALMWVSMCLLFMF